MKQSDRYFVSSKLLGRAALDSAGLECIAASDFFVKRRDRSGSPWKNVTCIRHLQLAIVFGFNGHFILAFSDRQGPKPDVNNSRTWFQSTPSEPAFVVLLHMIWLWHLRSSPLLSRVTGQPLNPSSQAWKAREQTGRRQVPKTDAVPLRPRDISKTSRSGDRGFDAQTATWKPFRPRSWWEPVRELAHVGQANNNLTHWSSMLFYRNPEEPFKLVSCKVGGR
jgi:hypothetical protein